MFIGQRYQEGVVRYGGVLPPFFSDLLRWNNGKRTQGVWIPDMIVDYDIEILSVALKDTNPYAYSIPLAIYILDKSNTSVWSETDKDGNTIRDLAGYNPSFPYYWTDDELDVDVFNTYINATYVAQMFANFAGKESLVVYNSSLSCVQATEVHNWLETGGWWLLNRGSISSCGIIKADGIIWSI